MIDKEQDDQRKRTDQDLLDLQLDTEQYNIRDTILTRYYTRKSWKYHIGIIENIDITKK